jgi:hypothetical protein
MLMSDTAITAEPFGHCTLNFLQSDDRSAPAKENDMSDSQKNTGNKGNDQTKSGGSKQQTASTEKGGQQGGHRSDDRQQSGQQGGKR